MSDKKSVAVITLPGSFNYGNRLQNYAVTMIYESLGYRVDTLQIAERFNLVRQLECFARKVLGRTYSSPEDNMTSQRRAAFERFDSNIQMRTIDYDLKRLADEYDYFSVGSDQVWNPNYIVYNDDWFFLKFARLEQRIALAPSIGLDSLDFFQRARLRSGLKGFVNPSVRERRGAELIKECSGIDAQVICDPTLALAPEDWRRVSDDALTPQEPYVFTYLLGGIGTEAEEVLRAVTNDGKIPVVSLTDRQRDGEPDAGPAEFISLIDNAQHVVTDSFHAAVFSTLMRSPLTIVHRDGGASMFSRLETLAQNLGLEDKIYGSQTYSIDSASNYEGVESRVSEQRDVFINYLKARLND